MNISTVLGGGGFIGRHLASYLNASGSNCWCPERGDPDIFRRDLGTVFYCIGLTSDFRTRPYETVDAHVGVLREVLERSKFEKLIYLSSTRIYAGSDETREDQVLKVTSFRPDDLYNLSKLLGESLALNSGRACSVARLSNVLGLDMGADNFVGQILYEAKKTSSVRLQTALASCKDYIWIDDAVSGLIAIAEHGKNQIYNLASGESISHGVFAELLVDSGTVVRVADAALVESFPNINIEHLIRDADWHPKSVVPKLKEMINNITEKNT